MINFRKIRKTGGSTYIITLPKKWIDYHKIKAKQNLECIVQKDGNLLINPFQTHELRRVQKTGGSSFIISLPIEWIKSNNLKEKHEIALVSKENEMILLNPNIKLEEKRYFKKIQLDSKMNPNFLLRLIIGIYVSGYSKIEISTKKEFASKYRDVVIKFIKMAIGMEIVKETLNAIILQETIDINDTAFERGIIRMEILVKSMHKDIIRALDSNNPKILKSVILRDEEINKFHRFVRHQMNSIINNKVIPRYADINIEKLRHNFLMSQNIERIGDHTVNITKNISSNFNLMEDSNLLSKFKEISHLILSSLSRSILSWKDGDIILANDIIEKNNIFEKILNSFINLEKPANLHYSLYLIREELKKLHLLIINIAEIVIDSKIREM